MTSKAQKTTPNVRLKLAIVATGKKQRVIAAKARMHPVQLSKIVTGIVAAKHEEQQRLARVLGRSVDELFPAEALAS